MQDFILCIIFTVILVMIGIIFSRFFWQKRKDRKYLDALDTYENQGVFHALSTAREQFSATSLEYMALDKGMYYLQHSILMDYQTCFRIIENIFHSKPVKQKHKEILAKEKEKCQLLLTKND